MEIQFIDCGQAKDIDKKMAELLAESIIKRLKTKKEKTEE